MKFGASTSCYYPLDTEKALEHVIRLGFKSTEIFFNTYSELEPSFIGMLGRQLGNSGVKLVSVHPFSSFAEGHCLFGDYQRRADDMMELYRRYFDACVSMGADKVVIHGAMLRLREKIPDERYFERFAKLSEIADGYGVTLAQENVNAHFSESPEFLKKMRSQLGDRFKMVFDIKQAVRAGYDVFDFLETFLGDIVHIHISDNTAGKDCMPPGKGTFDFKKFFSVLDENGYTGYNMIEIYHDDYNVDKELAESRKFLLNL